MENGELNQSLPRSQIAKETKYKSPVIGPTPIHPDVVVVIGERKAGSATSDAYRSYADDDDIYLVFDESKKDISDIAFDLFFEFGSVITDFYEVMVSRRSLIEFDQEIGAHFSAVSSSVSELVETRAWKLWATHSLTHKAKSALASIHQRLVEFGTEEMEYDRSRKRFISTLKKVPALGEIAGYFREMTLRDVELPKSLAAALGFFEGELQLYGNIQSLLAASLIGAVVGAMLTGAIGLFRH